MTKRVFALAGLVALALAAPEASAQLTGARRPPLYGPGYRPALSPYLNLIRGGDPAANYYLGTRPEQQRRRDAADFRNSITDLEVRTADVLETGVPRVGFDNRRRAEGGTYFDNTAGFYPRQPVPQPRTPPGQLPPRRRTTR